MEKLTLDTNIPLEFWKNQRRRGVVELLLALAESDEVSLMVTARIREDVPRDPLAREVDCLAELGIVEGPSITRLGYWKLGRDMLASDDFVAASEAVDGELRRRNHRPPDWRDWDHIHAHMLQKRDVYLTWDRRVLQTADVLRDRFGIRISTPEQYLASRS